MTSEEILAENIKHSSYMHVRLMNYIQIWFSKVMLCLLGYVNAMVQIVRM